MSKQLGRIVASLLTWYQKNKRDLPWRKDKNPYHVWISEIMLQQTRIEAVMNYYQRFMARLPSIQSLAKINEDELLKLWEGLGYYSRAKNIKKATQKVMADYDGKMPESYAELLKLPGIGEYTAGAIASICYNEKVTAVDGNVLRVISRVIGSKKDVLLPETKKEIEEMLREVMPDDSGDFNEGLMELGELVCVPNGMPACDKCPLKEKCIAFHQNLIEEIPVRIKKIKRKKEEKTVFILQSEDGRIAIQKREEKGLLSGMYEFPNQNGYLSKDEVYEIISGWKMTVQEIKELQEVKHVFTHVDWYMKGFLATVKEMSPTFIWASKEELTQKYALPTAFRKFKG